MWRNLTSSRPHWLSSGPEFTPTGLKAFFEVVAQQAFAAGVKRGRADERIERELARRRRRNYAGFLKHLYANLGAPNNGEVPPEDDDQADPQRAA